MKARQQVSRAAIELIKRFEGYRRRSAQLADGRWTIGYGHTLTAREGAEVSEQDAEALLLYDLIAVAHAVNERVYTPLTQNQFDALCAFAFNIGLENFEHSAVLRRINEGALIQAACGMELWRKAEFEGERIVVDALVRRRSAEKTLFLTPPGGWVPVPTPILRPNIDLDAEGVVPRQVPAELAVPLEGPHAVVERVEAPPVLPSPPEPAEEAEAEAEAAVAEAEESPAQAAAASVTSRLATIFRVPDPAPVDKPAEAPRPLNDDGPGEAAAPEPEPAGPLFRPTGAEPVQTAPAETPRLVIDEPTSFRGAAVFEEMKPEWPKFSYLPLAALAVVGLAFFAGGLFWAFNARGGPDGGLFNPLTIGWLAGIAGVALFGVAAYLMLDRLGSSGLPDEDLY